MKRKRTKREPINWIVVNIVEAFPVFYSDSHIPHGSGGYIAPNSKHYMFPEMLAHAEHMREYLTKDGYTVTITRELR